MTKKCPRCQREFFASPDWVIICDMCIDLERVIHGERLKEMKHTGKSYQEVKKYI